mmetsp:Transcript_51652/g.121209  ORF Transcript_51652/g.121209 Transcript_51652/m.121209 type:complete len:184 (+) Transcript_51652:381-932(+)
MEDILGSKEVLTRALSLSSTSSSQWRNQIETLMKLVHKKEWEQTRAEKLTRTAELRQVFGDALQLWQQREQASGKGAEQVASRATRLSSLMDELLENSTRNHSQEEVPECFACPITFATFNDPVVCPNGTTYERSAIEQHLSSNGAWDPLTRAPLKREQLYSNLSLKHAVEDFQKKNPWAYFE